MELATELLKLLPGGWEERAQRMTESEAKEHKHLGIGVWQDNGDYCSDPSIIVVTADGMFFLSEKKDILFLVNTSASLSAKRFGSVVLPQPRI